MHQTVAPKASIAELVIGSERAAGRRPVETHKYITSLRCSMQELLLEPLVGSGHGGSGGASGAQPHSGPAAVTAAPPSPWVPAAPSVVEWNTAAERPEAAESSVIDGGGGGVGGLNRTGTAAAPSAQRVWPAEQPGGRAASGAGPDVPAQLAGAQLDVESPQRQPGGAPGDEAATCREWNAFSGAESPCMRAFPCPADAPRTALVRGLAAVRCRSAGGDLRPGVVWYDAKQMLHYAPLPI